MADAGRTSDVAGVTRSTLAAASAAERNGIPVVCCQVTPIQPSAAFPRAIGPYQAQRLRLGGRYNRLTHEAVNQLFWSSDHDIINAWRVKELGLPPLPWVGRYPPLFPHGAAVPLALRSAVRPRPP